MKWLAPLVAALLAALVVACDGGAPGEPTRPVRVTSVDTLRPGQLARLHGADLARLRSLLLDGVQATELVARADSVSVRLLGAGDAGTPMEPAVSGVSVRTADDSPTPVPFDSRYATAVAGGTPRFVDWFSGAPQICSQPAASVPSFRAKVVAVSGKVAVVVDLRHPSAAALLDPAKLGWLRDAAAMTDRLLLPTMRSVFDPDYLPPTGGGGRYYVMLGDLPAAFQGFTGFAYDGPLPTVNVASQASCPRSSEMVVTSVSAERLALPEYQNTSFVAGLFIHEYAHNADLRTSRRDRASPGGGVAVWATDLC